MSEFKRPSYAGLLASGFVATALLLVAQIQAIRDLWLAWQTEEYSHGVVVVVLVIIMAVHKLNEEKPVLRPSWLGIPFFIVAAGLQFVAQLAAFDTAAEYGLILSLAGLSLSFLGRKATTVILPCLAYLIFAVPLPHLFQADLSQKLQLLSSTLGVGLLDLVGIPVFQEGNIIDLGVFKLQVVEACNGLRYLFPLMSFGYLIALLYEAPLWKRSFIFLSTIPIAIGLNAARIAVIGVTVAFWGQKMAEGFLHGFEGWTVFILCLLILFGEIALLQRIGKPGRFHFDYFRLPKGQLSSGITKKSGPGVAALLIMASLAFVFGTNQIEQRAEIHPPHPPLATFPLSFGSWQGRQDSLPSDVLGALKLSDYWLADYTMDTNSPPINLYMAYYESQRIGTTTHSPSNCIPGGGWQIEQTTTKSLPLSSGVPLKLTELLIRHDKDAELVDYWFQERGRDLTETTIAKWYLLEDSLMMHRTDGALIRVSAPLSAGEKQAAAEEQLHAFIDLVYPSIMAFIPDAPVTVAAALDPSSP